MAAGGGGWRRVATGVTVLIAGVATVVVQAGACEVGVGVRVTRATVLTRGRRTRVCWEDDCNRGATIRAKVRAALGEG